MKTLDITAGTIISLLNVTQSQAHAIGDLLRTSPHGIRITAGWHNRKPVIDVISSLPPPVKSSIICNGNQNSIDIRPGDVSQSQKILKAFGNRLADAARKPLQFQRVRAAGMVHFTPSFHHIAACGMHCVNQGSEENVNCISCLLAAVTPTCSESKSQYAPFGHILLRDAEIFALRDQACNRSR